MALADIISIAVTGQRAHFKAKRYGAPTSRWRAIQNPASPPATSAATPSNKMKAPPMVMPKFRASVCQRGRVSLTSYARFNALRTPSTPRDAEYKVMASTSELQSHDNLVLGVQT